MTWANYANTGPFNNNALPAITATFLGNVESFLDQIISSAAGDSHLTADGNGLVTLSGTSGVKVSSVRDTNNNTALDLSAGSGLVKLPHGATLTGGAYNLLTGSISRISLIGDTTIAHGSGGTSVSHGLGVTPSFVIPVLDAGSPTGPVSIFVNYGTMNSSSFTAYTSGSIDTGNVRFFCMAL